MSHDVNPGYALGQWARALSSAESHEDPELQQRARTRAERWLDVLKGMATGALRVGSRTPVKGMPAWVTPEVLHGGFASGHALAGGPLQPHETLPRSERNARALTAEGLEELRGMLHTGNYRVKVPEEGALLAAAWLAERGEIEEAEALVAEIQPFFDRLRFYPIPHPRPATRTGKVRRQCVAEVVRSLRSITVPLPLQQMRETVAVWIPLHDRLVHLWLQTVEEGWPCRVTPPGWREAAGELLREVADARRRHTLSRRPVGKHDMARMLALLERYVAGPQSLSGRDVGFLRKMLGDYVARHGEPTSERCRAERQAEAEALARPTQEEIAQLLLPRLEALPQDEGVEDLEPIVRGIAVPPRLLEKLRRCWEAPVPDLVRAGVLGSAEGVARVLPQRMAALRAQGAADEALGRLYAALSEAFASRRSLLLLRLEHQVRFAELPWTRPLARHVRPGTAIREELRTVVSTVLQAFPQTLLPNVLVRELDALAREGELGLTFVEEVAADIFMGEFSQKFLRAAKEAGALLDGSLYARYYDVPYARIAAFPQSSGPKWGVEVSAEFRDLCRERAGPVPRSVAGHGRILEQAQILTTHNLAPLIRALEPELDLPAMARECFRWIGRRLHQPVPDWHGQLIRLKNCAYAWRQMIVYLSLMPTAEVAAFRSWMHEEFAGWSAPRFLPAVNGLERAFEGLPPEQGPEARRFLGWTVERHWLMDARATEVDVPG